MIVIRLLQKWISIEIKINFLLENFQKTKTMKQIFVIGLFSH